MNEWHRTHARTHEPNHHRPADTRADQTKRTVVQCLLLLNTGLTIVDHIHFQYNGFLYGRSKPMYCFSPRICSRTRMGVLRPPTTPSAVSRGGSLPPSIHADARYIGDVTVSQAS